MSQNIEQYLKYISFQGQRQITSLINIKNLKFADPKLLTRRQPQVNELVDMNRQTKVLSEKGFSIISKLVLLLKQCQLRNVSTNVFFNLLLSYQQKLEYCQNQQIITADQYYIATTDIYLNQEEIIIKKLYSFIHWIILHQNGLRQVCKDPENSYQNIAHIILFENNESKIVIIVGFNKLLTEALIVSQLIRADSYLSNKLPISYIPQFNQETLSHIIYHTIIILRKNQQFNDTTTYNQELKQLISANALLLLENPQKENHIPNLGNFNRSDLYIYEINSIIADEFEITNISYKQYSNFMMKIINSMPSLFINTQTDMAYCCVLSNNYLLIVFQYKIDYAQLLDKTTQLSKIINNTYDYLQNKAQKLLLPNNQYDEQIQQSERKRKISEIISNSVSTAFAWYNKPQKEFEKKNYCKTPTKY